VALSIPGIRSRQGRSGRPFGYRLTSRARPRACERTPTLVRVFGDGFV
jgi:hypothetical protein